MTAVDFAIEDKWSGLSKEERHLRLFDEQKRLLDTFLAHHAISQAQYNKSLVDLTAKMGMGNHLLK
jgi:hypothetical protein